MSQGAFPYPGNKARLAKWILNYVPEHSCYVELFGGAAGLLLNKPRSKIEVYNDLNGDIPQFFRVLRDSCEELQAWLENVPFSREVYQEWATEYYNGYRPESDIERAGRFFALRYMQFGGKIEAKVGFAYRLDGSSTASQFCNKVDSLHELRGRFRDVEIENEPALDLIERRDSPDTFFYADPPYEGTEERYNSQGFDHEEFATSALSIEGNMAISYDSIPEFYGEDCHIVSKDSTYAIDGKGGNKETTEYLIMNYDPNETNRFSGAAQQGFEAYE